MIPVNRHPNEKENGHPVYKFFMNRSDSKTFSRDETRNNVIPAYMGLIKQIDDHMGKLFKKNENGVLNLGQTGNGPLRQYATLREYLPLKKVKRVIWFYSEGNDLKELNEEYDKLTEELNDNGPNEGTLDALIDNLKFRLNLVLRLKEKLQEFNDDTFAEESI